MSVSRAWCPKIKLIYQFDIYLHSNYYWLNIKGCAYQRTNFSMSKLSKSLCNFLASQISHQKQPWSEKILQMSEMYKIWIQNTPSSGWACQVISYDKGKGTLPYLSLLDFWKFKFDELDILSILNLIFCRLHRQ